MGLQSALRRGRRAAERACRAQPGADARAHARADARAHPGADARAHPGPPAVSELTGESAPAAAKLPTITKNPTGEVVEPGGTAYFVARANGATAIAWVLADAEGVKGYNAKDIAAAHPGTACTGADSEMLCVTGIDASMDGWKVICKFSNADGAVFTESAVITVIDYTRPCRTLDEVLVRIMTEKRAGTAGVSLAHARAAAQIADFISGSQITAPEVRTAVQTYTQRLSADHRISYRENALSIVESFRQSKSDPDGFKGLLSDAGYEPKSFPWDEARIAECFDALIIK